MNPMLAVPIVAIIVFPIALFATDSTTTALLITTIAGFLTTTVTQLFQAAKQKRDSAAHDKDRLLDRQERIDTALVVKMAMENRADELQSAIDRKAEALALLNKEHAGLLLRRIDDNTAITIQSGEKADAAFVESNTHNLKLIELAKSV